jgi:hypothetical protein
MLFLSGQSLICLQCDGVLQPIFCRRVVDCYDGEVVLVGILSCLVDKMYAWYIKFYQSPQLYQIPHQYILKENEDNEIFYLLLLLKYLTDAL